MAFVPAAVHGRSIFPAPVVQRTTGAPALSSHHWVQGSASAVCPKTRIFRFQKGVFGQIRTYLKSGAFDLII